MSSESPINRSVLKIIPQIIEVISKDKTEIILKLNNYRNSLFNQAPEVLMTTSWIGLINILNNMMHLFDEDEISKIKNITNPPIMQ